MPPAAALKGRGAAAAAAAAAGSEEEDEGAGALDAQLAALAGGLGLPPGGAEEQVDQADVDKLVNEVLASVKGDGKARGAGAAGAAGAAAAQAHAEADLGKGNECLQTAIKAVRAAVALDSGGKPGSAALQYQAALGKFAEALTCGVPTSEEGRGKVVQQMAGYFDRVQAILLAQEPQPDPALVIASDTEVPYPRLFEPRLAALGAMGKHGGFGLATRGLALRKRARAEAEASNAWAAFLLYSEAIDTLVALLKVDPKSPSAASVEKAVVEMLGSAETLKKLL
jgi:hypothetical protein